MKSAPFNLEKALAGHPLITRDGRLVTQFHLRKDSPSGSFPYAAVLEGGTKEFFTSAGRYWGLDENMAEDLFLALPDDPPLSPEEQAVIDAMRSGHKVTVEEPPKPAMPRRCEAAFYSLDENDPNDTDPWTVTGLPGSFDPTVHEEIVQLIELTPEVTTALLAAGIRWEDAPTGNQLPNGLPPLPEGAVYLGEGRTFETACEFQGWSLINTPGSKWRGGIWFGHSPNLHYAAPYNSKTIHLNSKP